MLCAASKIEHQHFVELEYDGKTDKQTLLDMATGTNKLATVDGDTENGMMQAGQSLLPLRKVEPVKAIMDSLMQETRQTLANAGNIRI